MMSNLRLLAGLTSFISCRYFVHFIATGPDGIFELSITLISELLSARRRRALSHKAKHDGQRNQTVSDEERKRGDLRQLVEKSERLLAPQPQGLKQAAHPVAKMREQQAHRNDVEDRNHGIGEAGDHHSINIVPARGVFHTKEPRSDPPESEVREVEQYECEDDQTADPHRAVGERRGHRLFKLVADGARAAVGANQLRGGHDVQGRYEKKANARRPQERRRSL